MSTIRTPVINTEYTHYFKVLDTMSKILEECVSVISSGKNAQLFEKAFVDLIARLKYTSNALHLKYAYSHAALSGEAMRIKNSGFPHVVEINDMLIDLTHRSKSAEFLESVEKLKQDWIDAVLEAGEDDHELLWRIGERRYLDILDPDKMLLSVVTGDFEERGCVDDQLQAAFWWLCYDPGTHSPCIHVLEFTQDISEDTKPVYEKGPSQMAFLQTIRDRGNRASNVSIVAADIDIALPDIHPKRLTRIHADKLYSPAITNSIGKKSLIDEKGSVLLREYAHEHDFMLHFIRDVVESKGQEKTSLFRKQVSEVFDLSSTKDAVAIGRGATQSGEYLILPHSVAQYCEKVEKCSFEPYQLAKQKLVYSNGGHVDAVK